MLLHSIKVQKRMYVYKIIAFPVILRLSQKLDIGASRTAPLSVSLVARGRRRKLFFLDGESLNHSSRKKSHNASNNFYQYFDNV